MARKKIKRSDDISDRPTIRKRLLDVFDQIGKGFEDQNERSDRILEYWEMFNCKLSNHQFYNGNTELFVPIVHDAIKARVTRFANQIFPQSGRYVDVTANEADLPMATMSLLETYVDQSKMRTQVVPALLTSGDVEGQYTVYADWQTRKRHVTERVRKPIEVMGAPMEDLPPVEDFESSVVVDAWPRVEVIADTDLLVLPATVDSIEEAIGVGGTVTVIRRWTRTTIEAMIDAGDIDGDAGDALIEDMRNASKEGRKNTGKVLADAAGIKDDGRYALVWETWLKIKVEGEMRLCRAYYAGDQNILGCKLNPYWCDECPVISVPVEKVPGVFKGMAPVHKVYDLQVLANDIANESADTGHFSAMPIIMTDPEKNPRVASMVLGLGAIWETSPNDTSFAEFPDMWATMGARLDAIKNQILQSLGVNPAMIPQGTGGDKRNQAEIATEQQVDILTTADAVTIIEQGILTPLIQRFAAYDSQFRDDDITVRVYGEMGLKATMEEVEPLQLGKRFVFKWLGVEAARNAAQMQQQIAWTNVLKGIPPAMYAPYKINLAPMLVQGTENVFGPRLAPQIFTKEDQISVDPMLENGMLQNGLPVLVHPADDDAAHLQAHMQLLPPGVDPMMSDPSEHIRGHIQQHQAQMQAKAMAQMQSQQQQAPPPQPGLPGTPGGAGPGVAGTPRPGAQPQGPRLIKGPEGMIPPEQMPAAGAVSMPRKY